MLKNKICYFIIGLILIVIIVLIAIFIPKNKYESNNQKVLSYITLDSINSDIGKYKLFTSFDETKKYFNRDNITKEAFDKYNYLLVKITKDSCSESNIKANNYEVINDVLQIEFTYDASCGVCAPMDTYYVIEIDKNLEFNDIDIKYKRNNKPNCNPNVAYKPIIYLYPKNDMNINVKLLNSNYLTTTYPKYNNDWDVYAYKDGTLIDNKTNRKLYGLYWEGNNYYSKVEDNGFVVLKDDLIPFLEEKLSILGLNEREADEFIIYWLPILEKNKYNYIHFASIEKIDNYMPLDINPKPDTVIRVLMEYKPLNKYISIEEQKLETPKRNGFTVVEWGGSLIN